jgi:hypothetical protein
MHFWYKTAATGTGILAISIFFHRVYKISILHWKPKWAIVWCVDLTWFINPCNEGMYNLYGSSQHCHIKICILQSFRTWTKHALNAFFSIPSTDHYLSYLFENFEQYNIYTQHKVPVTCKINKIFWLLCFAPCIVI